MGIATLELLERLPWPEFPHRVAYHHNCNALRGIFHASIRCGGCMNTCPVYRRSGGLSYGAVYSGPIGLIVDPTFNRHKYGAPPYASS